MKKKLQLAMTAAFMAILILPSLAWGVLRLCSRKNPAVMERLDYDLGENRNKAPFPESFSLNEFTKQLEAYYNDRAPFRSVLIRWNQRFSGKLEAVYQASVEPRLIAWLYGSETPGSPDLPALPSVDLAGNMSGTGQTQGNGTAAPPDSAASPVPPGEKHNYLVAEQHQPTCVEEGSVTYRCGDCGDTYTETLPATGHTADARVVGPSYLNGLR